VAVNVFFRTFEPSAYNPSDIYGNKDLVAGKEACDLASRAGSALDELPEPFRSFYARRAVKALANQLAVRINEEW
jgi:tRNA wybutosine-synthesizing protein 5